MNDIDRRLAAANRVTPVAAATLDALAVAAREQGRISRRQRLTTIGLSAVLVVGGGVAAAPAAADVVQEFLAQANWFPGSGGEILPDSERVDTSQPDLRVYLETIYPTWLELAPGQDRDDILDTVAESSAANPGLTQEASLRRMIETRAYCGWSVELLDAERTGDERRYVEAADVVLAAADWPALVATDGGGITDRLRQVGADAVNREHGAAHAVFRAGECSLLGFSSGAGE